MGSHPAGTCTVHHQHLPGLHEVPCLHPNHIYTSACTHARIIMPIPLCSVRSGHLHPIYQRTNVLSKRIVDHQPYVRTFPQPIGNYGGGIERIRIVLEQRKVTRNRLSFRFLFYGYFGQRHHIPPICIRYIAERTAQIGLICERDLCSDDRLTFRIPHRPRYRRSSNGRMPRYGGDHCHAAHQCQQGFSCHRVPPLRCLVVHRQPEHIALNMPQNSP